MRYDGLDLNLLAALEALLEERNVSSAARRLHLTQPAVTGALNRLRAYFQDDLLVLQGRKMQATPKAEALYGPVRRALLQIRGEITRAGDFDPASTIRHFRIIASDYAYTIALSHVLAHASHVAPNVTFEIIPPSILATDRLERAEIDLAITVRPYVNPHCSSIELWRDNDVIISCRQFNHSQITEETFFRSGHAVATFGPDRQPTVTDQHIAGFDRERHVEVLLPSFADLCLAIVGTQRLATMHRRYAEHFALLYPIAIHPIWHAFPDIVQVAQWHKIRDGDPGVRWLLTMLREQIQID